MLVLCVALFVDTTIDLLATHKRNALIQQHIYEALKKSAPTKDIERTTKAQDTLLDAEARAQALAHLQNQTLDAQMDQLPAKEKIEHQLQAIKEENAPSLQPLPTNEPRRQTSPLTLSPPPLERTQPANQQRLRKTKVQTEPIISQDLDIEQLKKSLDQPDTSDS